MMMYAVLCFISEASSSAGWSPGQDAENMCRIDAVTARHVGQIPYMARLSPTSSAVSVRRGRKALVVVDGPFVESKEHLVGFYVVECNDLDQAVTFASDLMAANPWGGGYEVRPVHASKAG